MKGDLIVRNPNQREERHHRRHAEERASDQPQQPEEGRGHHGRRNFWREWRAERRHHGLEADFFPGQPLSPKEMQAWREFFHKNFGNWPEQHWIFGGRRFSPWHQGMDSFNPFVASLLSKGGALLPLYVLHLVSQKPRYGNEIMDILAQRTNGQWVSNPGAIYPLLNLLEREGFIDGKWEDPEKRTVRIYSITPLGEEELKRIKIIVTPKVEETAQVLQELLQELHASDDEEGKPPAEPSASPETAEKAI